MNTNDIKRNRGPSYDSGLPLRILLRTRPLGTGYINPVAAFYLSGHPRELDGVHQAHGVDRHQSAHHTGSFGHNSPRPNNTDVLVLIGLSVGIPWTAASHSYATMYRGLGRESSSSANPTAVRACPAHSWAHGTSTGLPDRSCVWWARGTTYWITLLCAPCRTGGLRLMGQLWLNALVPPILNMSRPPNSKALFSTERSGFYNHRAPLGRFRAPPSTMQPRRGQQDAWLAAMDVDPTGNRPSSIAPLGFARPVNGTPMEYAWARLRPETWNRST